MRNYIEPTPKNTISRSIKLDGIEIAYWEKKSKDMPIATLVLLHGNSSSKSAFFKLFEAEEMSRFRLLAFDFIGCGESSDAKDLQSQYTIPALAKIALSFTKFMQLVNYSLLGWSLGGHIAIEMLNHGANPKALILTGTPPCGPAIEEIATTFLPVPGAEVTSAETPTPDLLEAYIRTLYSPSEAPDILAKAVYRADGRLRSNLFAHFLTAQDMKPQRQTIAETQIPIALIQGELEPFFDPKLVDKLAFGNLWRGQTQWISGAGHAPFLDKPSEYAKIATEFLAAGNS